jgi:hypothetical protein
MTKLILNIQMERIFHIKAEIKATINSKNNKKRLIIVKAQFQNKKKMGHKIFK